MAGIVYGVGVGPGDPELMTLKAARVLAEVPVVAHFTKRDGRGRARAIVETYLRADAVELALAYPFTVEIPAHSQSYRAPMEAFYDECAARIARWLDKEKDVAVLCEGDPLFYGSYIYLHDRLAARYETVVIPGVTSIAGCAAMARIPLISTNDVFAVIPGTLPEAVLESRLANVDGAAIIKLGRNFPKVRRVLNRLGLAEHASYIERGTTPEQIAMRLSEKENDEAVYFSLVLVPGYRKKPREAAA